MKKIVVPELIKARVRTGFAASDDTYGLNGMFKIKFEPTNTELVIVASTANEQYKWEHVSISTKKRCPNWLEMCFVKDLFWEEDETVIQFHPPKSQYVNNYSNCLHLWKNLEQEIILPPQEMLGIKELGTLK